MSFMSNLMVVTMFIGQTNANIPNWRNRRGALP
jgi:hypothetical protein